jgi:homoserine dehydrogenase
MKKIQIGLIGFGVVGSGFYEILQKEKRRKDIFPYEIKRIAIKNIDKPRPASAHLFTANYHDIINDPEITVVIELIDDAECAYQLIKSALLNKKHVISANKKMLSEHINELHLLATQQQCSLLYEAAVAGSIPILRNLENYYSGGYITTISGIINGSTNYILSEMQARQIDYKEALAKAQGLGFAESDPTLDVSGADAQSKLQLLAFHAFGTYIPKKDIPTIGIAHLQQTDLAFAQTQNAVIKLLASCNYDVKKQKHELSVLPTLLPKEHRLAKIEGAFNGILVGQDEIGFQLFEGAGAGSLATGSAVYTDLKALERQYQYTTLNKTQAHPLTEKKYQWYIRGPLTALPAIKKHSEISFLKVDNQHFFGIISCSNSHALALTQQVGFAVLRFLNPQTTKYPIFANDE